MQSPWFKRVRSGFLRQDETNEVSALVHVLEQIEGAVSHLADVGTPLQKERAVTELESVKRRLYQILGDDEATAPEDSAVSPPSSPD